MIFLQVQQILWLEQMRRRASGPMSFARRGRAHRISREIVGDTGGTGGTGGRQGSGDSTAAAELRLGCTFWNTCSRVHGK